MVVNNESKVVLPLSYLECATDPSPTQEIGKDGTVWTVIQSGGGTGRRQSQHVLTESAGPTPPPRPAQHLCQNIRIYVSMWWRDARAYKGMHCCWGAQSGWRESQLRCFSCRTEGFHCTPVCQGCILREEHWYWEFLGRAMGQCVFHHNAVQEPVSGNYVLTALWLEGDLALPVDHRQICTHEGGVG